MKSFRTYIILFLLVIAGYTIYEITSPKDVSWFVTYSENDKNPFGLFILNDRFTDLFPDEMETSYLTLSQIEEKKNILIFAENVEIDGADLKRLFELLSSGTNVFIVGNEFGYSLTDTLGVSSYFPFNKYGLTMFEEEESIMTIENSEYTYPRQLLNNSFDLTDSSEWKVLAETGLGPMAIQKTISQGTLTLVTNGLIFSNFGMLYNENFGAAAELLRSLPFESVHYTKFYQFGRPESQSPFRYFLKQPALRWAVYLGLFTIATLLIIDSWRKQRKIPVVLPPTNDSVRYAKTLGGLYHREADHINTARKLIGHFFGMVRERYLLDPEFSEGFYQKLAGKSSLSVDEVRNTFGLIEYARKVVTLDEKRLAELSKKIDQFK